MKVLWEAGWTNSQG